MRTYQDFLKLGENEAAKIDFWNGLMTECQGSDKYITAKKAIEYYYGHNPDIVGLEKWVYDMQGRRHPDLVSPNHKIRNNYYPLIIDELVSHVISNGVSFKNDGVKEKLGIMFDDSLMDIVTDAKNCGAGYGFWAADRLIRIPSIEFAPCYDEMTGELAAGVRFYQIDSGKPTTMTVYESDGFTVYIKDNNGINLKQPKTRYKQNLLRNEIQGYYADTSENYASLPIIPLYNINKQSAIVGNLEILIAIDIISSTLINSTCQGELIYWVLKNYAGMDEIADWNFIANFMKTHIVHVDGDGDATPNSISTPYEANEAAAARLKDMLFENMRGVNVQSLSAGNLTATYIDAAYTRLRESSAKMEAEIRKFIYKLFKVAGIPDTETFTFQYNEVINVSEMIDNIKKCETNFGQNQTRKMLAQVMGVIDDLPEMEQEIIAEETARMMLEKSSQDDEEEEETEEIQGEETS